MIEFHNPSNEVLFDLCMVNIHAWELTEEPKINIDEKKFHKLLNNNDLEDFKDLLFGYQIILSDIHSIVKTRRSKYDDYYNKVLPYQLKIASIVKMFLASDSNTNNTLLISISDIYNKEDLSEIEIINQQKELFLKEFERLGLNETILTKEEASEELNEGGDWDWLYDYGYDPHEINDNPDLITEGLVEFYRQNHYKPREITLELVVTVIKDLEHRKNKKKGNVGAKIKNTALGELAIQLSYLHRINDFLKQNEYNSIKDFPLSNKTCYFIYHRFSRQ